MSIKSHRIGIDYSLSSPSLAIVHEDGSVDFHFCCNSKKFWTKFAAKNMTFTGHPYPVYRNNQERFDIISTTISKQIKNLNIASCHLEGYAFAAKGRVFDIAEATGLLKYRLYQNAIDFETLSPSTIKKFATGKGNAKKPQMYDAFFAKTGVDLFQVFGLERNEEGDVPSPLNDLVDAYFVALTPIPKTA